MDTGGELEWNTNTHMDFDTGTGMDVDTDTDMNKGSDTDMDTDRDTATKTGMGIDMVMGTTMDTATSVALGTDTDAIAPESHVSSCFFFPRAEACFLKSLECLYKTCLVTAKLRTPFGFRFLALIKQGVLLDSKLLQEKNQQNNLNRANSGGLFNTMMSEKSTVFSRESLLNSALSSAEGFQKSL